MKVKSTPSQVHYLNIKDNMQDATYRKSKCICASENEN